MKRIVGAGLSANKLQKTTDVPTSTPPIPPPSFDMSMSNSIDFSMSARAPMQQMAFGSMAPRKPLSNNDNPFGGPPSYPSSFNVPPPMQQASPAPMAPRKPLVYQEQQQASVSGMAPRNMMKQESKRSLAPNKPLSNNDLNSINNISNLPVMNFAIHSLAPNKPISTYDPMDIDITPAKPINVQDLDLSKSLPKFDSLRDRTEEFIITRTEQLPNLVQSKFAKPVLNLEPVVLTTSEFEQFYNSGVKIAMHHSLRSPNEIDDEISNLKELWESGYITHQQYSLRLSELTVEKKFSSIHIIPHVDYGSMSSVKRSKISTTKARNVRIFISSTFRDMKDEREHLINHVIPQLKEFCKSRGVFLTVVDLRWGITSEDTEKGDTISICLNEIDRCRPYFVSMLGGRYGWAQPLGSGPRDKLLEKTFANAMSANVEYSWLKKYDDRSITELEIRHAVLNDPQSETARRSLFCMKVADKSSVASVSLGDDDVRLSKLKEEILLNNFLKNNRYQTVEELGNSVLEHFKNVLNEDFPLKEAPNAVERERSAHLSFQESRANVYIGRQYYFDTINAHLASTHGAGPIVITGDSGSGKSALLANWASTYRETHPSQLLISHYIGSTSSSIDLGRLITRIMHEINQFFELGKESEIPSQIKDIIDAFPQWLREADRRGGVVILLDAMNELDHRYNAQDISTWLPRTFPQNVKLVLSTLPGRILNDMNTRGWKVLEVQSLSRPEKITLIQEYMAIYGKKLTEAQLDLIVNSKQAENPLYLRTLLEELRVFGVFEELEKKIQNYLSAQSPPQLFELVFARLETEFHSKHKGLVSDVLGSLWVSRRGLTESELLSVLSIPQNVWSPFLISINEMIANRSGFLSFFHDYMRQAVQQRYLSSDSNKLTYRTKLITYFNRTEIEISRRVEEVPYLFECSNQYSGLFTFITNIDNFKILLNPEYKFDMYRYWRLVSQNGFYPERSVSESLVSLESTGKLDEIIELYSTFGKFLQDIGNYGEAEFIAKSALTLSERKYGDNKEKLAPKWQELAYVYRLRGKYADAAPLYEKALQYMETLPNPDQQKLAQSINSLAILYRLQGKYDKAEPLYLRALEIRKKIFGEIHEDVAQSMNSLGCLNQDMGRLPVAEQYLLEAIRQREQLLGTNHPDVAMSLNNLGGLYLDWSKYGQAEPVYLRALNIYEKVFGTTHPSVAKSYHSLAGLYQEQGKYSESENMYRKCIKMREELLGKSHPDLALSYNDLAVLFARQDRYSEAEKFYTMAMNIRSEVLGEKHPDYAQSVKNLASLYQDQRNYNKALVLFKQGLDICLSVFGEKHQDTATSYSNLAGCYQVMGSYDEAVPLYERALRILQELLGTNHADVALALNDMAVLYFRKRDYHKAEELYIRAQGVYEAVFGVYHPHTGEAVLNLAHFYKAQNKLSDAITFFQKTLDIFSQCHGPDHYKTTAVQSEINQLSGGAQK
eukprot:TRINITY_DN552_c0_g1_i1.p1 TRINITY_DN552_c0_g1~~TRINITY_DN552_c0_g1_i1.p1  ORF type:complete len:1462 (+),score=367.44 TRINITY_DN552_c0_g1_i1:741-5126(+)